MRIQKVLCHGSLTLFCVSHDFYSKKLNDIIDKVDFCPVLQIFYPYTIQAFPGILGVDLLWALFEKRLNQSASPGLSV